MMEDDKSCEEILIQIGSAKAALHKTGQVILEGHLHHCVLESIKKGKEDETIKKLSSAIEQFSRIV
jgi:DNA-binding FrmR family transcriptional regulator